MERFIQRTIPLIFCHSRVLLSGICRCRVVGDEINLKLIKPVHGLLQAVFKIGFQRQDRTL